MQLEAYLLNSWQAFVVTATANIYNYIYIRCLKQKTPQEIFLGNKSKTLHFHVFGCGAYVFLPSEAHTNKLVLHFELMIFIGYENNGYCFMHHMQENIIFCSTHAIFDEGLFPKCTNSHVKEHKLYDKLLDKISSEIE